MVTLPGWEPRATVVCRAVLCLFSPFLCYQVRQVGLGDQERVSGPGHSRPVSPNLNGALCLENGNSRECDS